MRIEYMESGTEVKSLRKYLYVCCMLMISCATCASTSTWANKGEGKLIAAAGAGNLSRVKALLATRVNVNARGADGTTALIAASENGYEEVVQMLLEAKADV